MKEAFLFYGSWCEAIKDLPNDTKVEIYEATILYGTTGQLTELSPMAALAFKFIKEDLDRGNEKYQKLREKRSEAGKSGNETRWGNTTNKEAPSQTVANNHDESQTITNNNNESQYIANENEESQTSLNKNKNKNKIKLNKKSLSLNPSQTDAEREKERENFIFKEFYWLNRKNPEKETRLLSDNYQSQGWKKANGREIEDLSAVVRMWRCEEEGARMSNKHLAVLQGFCEATDKVDDCVFLQHVYDFKSEGDSNVIYCTSDVRDFIESHLKELVPNYKKHLTETKLGYKIR
ncbi:MAG: DUF6291 domain-containing protein [Bacteroidales bacterium]|nr:DUF6291 domain-containing protein [Bacteroidales bacterium]